MMAKVNGKDSETVINALVKHAHQLPKELYASLTWDRGKEMADHQRFTLSNRYQGVLLRPAEPLATWLEREHQWLTQTVLSKRN